MAFRLSDYVTGGFIINQGEYHTYGRLGLRGHPDVILVELVGYPAEDLMNKHLEFDVPENDYDESAEDVAALKAFKNRQIGPTGLMTAARRAPGQKEPSLFLEWVGPNGTVIIDLPVSKVHFLTPEEIAERDRLAREEWEERRREMGLGEPKFPDPNALEDAFPGGEEEDAELDFNLLPPEFEREMEQKAEALNREAMPPSEEEEKCRREFDLLEELVEGTGKETPVAGFLEGLEIPPTASIQSEAEAETYLKPLLARLARYGTAMDTCEHCTPRNAYRLLVDKLLPDLGVYEPLVGSDYVHHICAGEVCEECIARFEREYEDGKWGPTEPPV
jgi:hypothetical protein